MSIYFIIRIQLLGNIPLSFPNHDLKHNVELLHNSGFIILDKMEELLQMNLFDLGAVVYFAKQIIWDFPIFLLKSILNK